MPLWADLFLLFLLALSTWMNRNNEGSNKLAWYLLLCLLSLLPQQYLLWKKGLLVCLKSGTEASYLLDWISKWKQKEREKSLVFVCIHRFVQSRMANIRDANSRLYYGKSEMSASKVWISVIVITWNVSLVMVNCMWKGNFCCINCLPAPNIIANTFCPRLSNEQGMRNILKVFQFLT